MPAASTLRGRVAMIHQELHLMPSMTVAENIFLGREPLTRFGFVDHRALADERPPSWPP